MGQYFHVRDITRGLDIWDGAASLVYALENSLGEAEPDFPMGIFSDVEVIGFDPGGFNRAADLPPKSGISGQHAAQEMDYILARLDQADHLPRALSDPNIRALLLDLRAQFAAHPDHRFAGYIRA